MKKQMILLALLLGSMSLQAQQPADELVKKIEATYAASNPSTLRTNAEFKQDMREVIARGDASSAYVIGKYNTFIYMNGMKADVEASIAKMPSAVKESPDGQKTLDGFYRMRKLEVGMQVPDFTLPTPDGKQVNLYEFAKGKKCIILDFWASWCGWCRKESPNVQAVYDKYKGADFDVISVSFDDNRDRWLKAIEEDKTTWTQVSDLKGTDKSNLYAWYDLSGIPAILLLDGDCKVIKLRMRGDAIARSVEEMLNK